VSVIPSTSTLTTVTAGAVNPDRDCLLFAGASVVMEALWQSRGHRCDDTLIYPSAVRIRQALVPLALAACAALSACGGGDVDDDKASDKPSTSEAPSERIEEMALADMACSVLTADEVAEAVGAPVKQGIGTSGEPVTGGEFSTCVWQSDDEDNPADTATLTIYSNTAAADSVRGEDSQDLEGIGDQAFSDSVSSVWAYVGERSFFAQWYLFGTMDDEGLEQSKALAKAVADKLCC
jgi:Protein of unknown function (DUF3558)